MSRCPVEMYQSCRAAAASTNAAEKQHYRSTDEELRQGHRSVHRTTQITTEQHKKQLIWKLAGRDPSLRILPWHLPYN